MDALLDEHIELAEPEHLEEMFQALEDTVSGNESLSLSSAQQYAHSVLSASGIATRAEMVTGVEGFFSAIGDGAAKIWAYIKKMFQGIWNWFFGNKEKGPSITEQTEAMVKVNQEQMKAWARADFANNDAMRKQFDSIISGFDDIIKNGQSGDKRAAEQGQATLKAALALPPGQQAKAVKEAAEVFVKLNSRTQRAIDELCEQAINSNKKYLALVAEDHSASFSGTTYADDYSKFKDWSKGFEKVAVAPYLNIPKGMNRLEHAERAQDGLLNVIAVVKQEVAGISSTFKSSVIQKIKSIEKTLENKGLSKDAHDKFRKDLTACKIFLSLTTRHIKQLEQTQDVVKRLSNMIIRLFGMRPTK